MTEPSVITIILNTNKREDTLACLQSLAACTYANHRIMVLDNHSTDGSVEAIRAQYSNVQVVALAENLGYAGNNNVGIELALKQGADWVFVLNEDTIVDPACIARLVQTGESDPRIGIVGPMVYHFDEPDVIQSAGGTLDRDWRAIHRGQNEKDEGQYPKNEDVRWISGCAILVRRKVIEQVGALDARFFYYWEETEWCLRGGEAGWRVVHTPAAKIWHKGVQRDYRPGPNVTYYSTRNRFMLLAKHHASAGVWARVWLGTIRTLISWSLRPKWKHMRGHRDALVQGAMDFLNKKHGMRTVKTV